MQAITLFLLNKLSFLFNKKEINIEQLKAIVKVKLEINSRKTTGMLGQSTTGKQTSFTFGLILYSIFGSLFGSILLLQSSVLISFGILYAYIMVFIIMVLITDFSSVLLDTSDNTIILPKPVNSKTVFAARNTFIIIYISQIVLALSAGGIIFTFIKFGWIAGFLFIVSLAFITLFATNVTYALYLGVMSLTSEETMKNTINYLQIVMTVIFMGSYQLLPRLMGNLEDFTHILEFETWMIFAPPLWYATLQALLVQQIKFSILPVIALSLGICLPFILQLGIQKYFIPFFNKKLQDLATQNKADSKPEKKSNSKNFSFSLFLKKLVLLKPLEQASYLLTIQSLKADRKLKLRIYPSLGYMFVFVIIIFISISRENENWFIELNTSNHFLWLIYLCGFLMNTAQFETLHSENYKARWIYESSSIKSPGLLLTGSFKANLVYFMLPAYLIVCTITLFFWGPKIIDDLIFGFTNCVLISLLSVSLTQRFLPFSLPEEARTNGNNFARGLVMMLVVAVLCGVHYIVILLPYGATLAIVPAVIFCWLTLNSIQQFTWKQISF